MSELNELRYGSANEVAQTLDYMNEVPKDYLIAALINALNKIEILENRLNDIEGKA